MEITIAVNEETRLTLKEFVGDGFYKGISFDFCLTVPDHSFYITVEGTHYIVNATDVIQAVVKEHKRNKGRTKNVEFNVEVMRYIVENEPLAATKLAAHFGWTDSQKRRWVQLLRIWGWIGPRGLLESTKEGRRVVAAVFSSLEHEED